jgi:hypothetical protein
MCLSLPSTFPSIWSIYLLKLGFRVRRCVTGERFSDFVGLDSFKPIILHLQKFYNVDAVG